MCINAIRSDVKALVEDSMFLKCFSTKTNCGGALKYYGALGQCALNRVCGNACYTSWLVSHTTFNKLVHIGKDECNQQLPYTVETLQLKLKISCNKNYHMDFRLFVTILILKKSNWVFVPKNLVYYTLLLL